MQQPRGLDIGKRLPSQAEWLVISTIFGLIIPADTHALPAQTSTINHHVLEVIPYPRPTPAPPTSKNTRRRRQVVQEFNTICGYIGGDPDLPTTCSAGSHCVVDSNVGAIGCCPNVGLCTSGVFTECVDANSGPQTLVNPYAYTCTGSEVCYRNQFAGGNFQYGCGSASNLAATVMPTASGLTGAPSLLSVSAPLTEDPATLSEPTTLGTISKSGGSTSTKSSSEATSSPTASVTAASSESASSSVSTPPTTILRTSTVSPSSTVASSPAGSSESLDGDEAGSGGSNQGAIIGGSIGGAAALIGLVALALFFWRKRRRGNTRQGPGPNGDIRYISPVNGNRNFTPVALNQEMYEQAYVPGPHGTTTTVLGGKGFADPGRHPVLATSEIGQPFGFDPPGEAIVAQRPDVNGQATVDANDDDRVPLTREYDDFSRGFNDALSRIEEEESRPATAVNSSGMSGHGNGYGAWADDRDVGSWAPRGGEGPLWQQNRRQSRNMMWMQQ